MRTMCAGAAIRPIMLIRPLAEKSVETAEEAQTTPVMTAMYSQETAAHRTVP